MKLARAIVAWLLLCGPALALPPTVAAPSVQPTDPRLLRPSNRVAMVGDSLICFGTQWNSSSSGTPTGCGYAAVPYDQGTNFMTQGLTAWIQFLTGGRIKSEMLDNWGVYGQTSTQILARIPAILATKQYGWVVLDMGENDPSNAIPVATTVANMQAAVALFQSAGVRVILLPLFPRGTQASYSSGSAATALALQQQESEINQQFAALAAVTPDLYFADVRQQYITPTTGYAQAVYTIADGLHNSPQGAFLWGQAVASILNAQIPAVDPLFAKFTDTFTPGHPTGNLLTNGLLQTSNALTASGIMTGVFPSNWPISGASGLTSGTAVWSLPADTTAGNCITLTLTGAAGSSNSSELFANQTINIGSNIFPGDSVQVMAELSVSGGSNLRMTGFDIRETDGVTSLTHFGMGEYNVVGYPEPAAYSGVAISPIITIRPNAASGTPSIQLRLAVIADGTQSGGASGVVKWCRVSLRKVTF